MKDAVATMGGLLPDDAGGRDAVHVAVISAVAAHKLRHGDDIGFAPDRVTDRGEHYATTDSETFLGIVDPFLTKPVMSGQRFWLYIYPRKITGLNHQWTHPDLANEDGLLTTGAASDAQAIYNPPASRLEAEQWLRDFCAHADCPGYEEVLGRAAHVIDGGKSSSWDDDYLHFDDQDAHGEIPPEFWDKVEIVLGRKRKAAVPSYFSCSC